MPRSTEQVQASEIARIKKDVKGLQSGRLGNASMHGSRLYIYDDDGDIREIIGNQGDGSYGSRVVKSPPQPTTTAPALTAGELGAVEASWDGGIVQGVLPVVHGYVQVWSQYVGEDGSPDSDQARLVSSIRDRDGGATTIVCATPGVWAVWFRMVGADRVTIGEFSEPSLVEVESLVNTEEIEQKLEEAERERQEYRDAFDERTSEYDRLMAEQEDALAESDAWSHTALYRADSAAAESAAARVEASEAAGVAQDAQARYEAVSSRQDASEAEIEAARQEAAAAHEEAGEARQYAASIADQVDGLGKTIRSTSPPSGTANEGDYWRQFDSMSRDRRLIGWWEYRDGAWDRLSLDVTVLPMAEIGQLVVDDARAQRIFAETGEITRLAVGDFENLLPESMLWEYAEQGLSSVSWQATSGGALGWTTITNRDQHPIRLRWQGSQYGSSTSRLAYGGRDGQGIPVKPGDQFHLSMAGWNGTSGLWVGVRYSTEGRSYVSRLTAFNITSDSPSGSWVVPNNTAIRRMQIEFTGGITASAGNADFGDIELRRVQAGELIVDGLLSATEGTINRLFTDTMVATSVWSQIVRTRLLEADEALIGDVLLKNGAVTTEKLNVTEAMSAAIGEFLYLSADHIDVNSLVFQSGMVGYLEAHGITLSNEAGRRRFEVSGDGFRLTDTGDDHVLAQLGTQSDDLISLHDSETGEPVITLGQDGGGSFRHISSELDPHLGGKPLAGDFFETPRWHASESVMGSLPLGVEAQHLRSFSADDSSIGGDGELAVTHLEAWITPGRLYRIVCHGFEMGNRENYFMSAYYETSNSDSRPARPTMDSIALGAQPGARPAVAGGNTSLSYEYFFAHGTARRIRILFAVGRYGGGAKTFHPSLRGNARFVMEDVGPNIGRTGQSLLQWAGSTSGSIPEPPRMLTQNYPVAQTATYTLDPSTGVATRQYTGGLPRFGYWTLTGQYHLTVVTFAPWDQAGDPITASPRMRVLRWGSSRGNIVPHGVPSFTNLPATFNFNTDVTQLEAHRNVGMGSIRAANLSAEQQAQMAGRANASLVLGSTGWDSSSLGYAASGIFDSNGVTASLSTEVEE